MGLSSDTIENEIARHELRNEALVSRLIELRVVLDKPRQIDLHFFAPSLPDAEGLRNMLRKDGHAAVTLDGADPKDGRVSVTATVTATVTEVTARTYIERHVRVASAVGGVHDGWGTSVGPAGE